MTCAPPPFRAPPATPAKTPLTPATSMQGYTLLYLNMLVTTAHFATSGLRWWEETFLKKRR